MRIEDEVSRDMSSFALGTGAGADAHTSIYSGATYGRGLDNEESESKCGSPESKSEPDASRRPVATALSWLVARLIEGFAAYGQGMHPSFVDLGECIDGRNLEWDSQRRPQTHDEYRREMPWQDLSHPRMSRDADRSSRAQAASPAWHARHISPVSRFWARIHHERRVRQTITKLEALDDQTLKDIGIHRCQAESIVRHGNR
jgi:uncharacterized protein YjiS (DUF1127 family)